MHLLIYAALIKLSVPSPPPPPKERETIELEGRLLGKGKILARVGRRDKYDQNTLYIYVSNCQKISQDRKN